MIARGCYVRMWSPHTFVMVYLTLERLEGLVGTII